jgi:hypothetical protein
MRWAFLFALVATAGCGPTPPPPNVYPDAGFVAPDCQGIECMNYCPLGTKTTISGRVTAPNGIDPVPGAYVYVPKVVEEFPGEVACEVCSQIMSDAFVATMTQADGTFTLGPIPTAENAQQVPVRVVAQKGRFRRVVDLMLEHPCVDNRLSDTFFKLPSRNDPAGADRIPKIAVATGDFDIIECVLLNLGIEQGQFDLYDGTWYTTPTAIGTFDLLFTDRERLLRYNIVFINCTGDEFEDYLADPTVRANVEAFVTQGGRLYVTDWSYDWIEQIPAWSPQIDFGPGASDSSPEPMNAAALGGNDSTLATVLDPGLASWLHEVEKVTGEEIIRDDDRVWITDFLPAWVMQYQVPANPATRTTVWLEAPVSGIDLAGILPLTTTFDHQECGRVLYSSYHTRGREGTGDDETFPNYCPLGQPLSPQERVLEYLILHIADCIVVD